MPHRHHLTPFQSTAYQHLIILVDRRWGSHAGFALRQSLATQAARLLTCVKDSLVLEGTTL